ncbi:MAG: OmpA family protein [Flavobacteriales bacterium]|nr:OmpA family protein [Flavobacteriales bacterium]
MNFKNHIVLLSAMVLFFIIGCIPVKKYEELKAKSQDVTREWSALKAENEELNSVRNEQNATIEKLKRKNKALQTDTANIRSEQRKITEESGGYKSIYADLLKKNAQLVSGDKGENKMLLKELDGKERSLQEQEDRLKILERDLNSKKIDLERTKMDLEEREIKVAELQQILNSKDSTVIALKSKVSAALLGLENNGLTITQKNGKVYVSLDESLLFASGSISVDPKGVEALSKLAVVLGKNKEVNVLIEGHTDNVPLSGKGAYKDNWDLSVIRATSIVKILLANGEIDANRLTPAGRGEFLPLDITNTVEGRKKNRRTEIILTPKLDELFEILGTN